MSQENVEVVRTSDARERRLVVAIAAERDRVVDSVVGRVAGDVVHFDRHV